MGEINNTDYQKIGARIRELRVQRGMSQADLAFTAHISLPHISDIELGKTKMALSTFLKVAEALQASTDVILRPDVPAVKNIYLKELQDLISDCTSSEIDTIIKVVKEVKAGMHAKKNTMDD